MASSLRRKFDAVDETVDPKDFIQYLDKVRTTEFFWEIKRRTLALMNLHPGEAALDVGCGTGEDVLAMEAQVGPSGRAAGVDLSSVMITAATERSHENKSKAHFSMGDAHDLPFEAASFDAVRAERLLQHTPDPQKVLQQIVRVSKSGGRIVVWEGDLDLFIIDAADYIVSRAMQRFICDQFQNGAVGHRLYRMFRDAGLVNVNSIPLITNVTDLKLIESAFDLAASVRLATEKGIITPERGTSWFESLHAASVAGRFFSTVGGYITTGIKQ
jgi:ubiquinone/menaquinone biosynthesis C-methylase UbiE